MAGLLLKGGASPNTIVNFPLLHKRRMTTQYGGVLEGLCRAQVTTAADIFSFGVVMWEVCTLEQPANRYMRAIEDHEAPPAIRKLFHDCIQENPAARPTAKEVLEVLMRD